MKYMSFNSFTPIAILSAFLAGCSSGPKVPDFVTQCMFEITPEGAYTYPAGIAVPTVIPMEGGTAEGAAAINACVQRKAAAAGVSATNAAPSARGGRETYTQQVISDGSTTRTYSYDSGRGTAARGRPNVFSPDQLPIPNEYPLLDGDHELWVTLTPAQQARAMLFLQDGSTIRSSLEDER